MSKALKGMIKCLVWDLDGTLWDGILLEDKNVQLKPNITHIIEALDKRGILQSVSSKNDYQLAMNKLTDFGLAKYFIYPQINWNSKADSIKQIAKSINIGLNAIAFIDDQAYERDEVNYSLPEVLCIDAANLDTLIELDALKPKFITKDSQIRRQMYLSEIQRTDQEKSFVGPKDNFLKSLDMELTIFNAREEDLQRAEELTVRTNQLNATGYTYSYDELKAIMNSDEYQLIMCRLIDKYGTYGHIGLMLIEKNIKTWTIKLMLMSCRVMSRGIGSVLLGYVMNKARENGIELFADFVSTDRNRLMNIAYRLAGFYDIGSNNGITLLKNDLKEEVKSPDYLTINYIFK